MDTKDEFFIPEEMIEWIGQKKSEFLSKLIELVSDDDFGFADYHLYDHHIPETIGEADRIFEETVDSQILRTCVKTYVQDKRFHQVVLGTVLPDENSQAMVFVPILSFVTNKDEVVREFADGEAVSRPTLN